MQELEFINTHLGGHRITLSGFKTLYGRINNRPLSVCEIGCGGGDNLKVIERWCRERNIPVRLLGIDINKECIAYAADHCKEIREKQFFVSDYRQLHFENDKPDIIFSSLFTHHLDDQEYLEMLEWCNRNASSGFFINDLHRHFLAYYSIKLLTSLFSKSYLVKNDAPLSVRRGFTRPEINQLIGSSGIPRFEIQWKWAFRWLIIVKK